MTSEMLLPSTFQYHFWQRKHNATYGSKSIRIRQEKDPSYYCQGVIQQDQ